jgi:hypothetical protein
VRIAARSPNLTISYLDETTSEFPYRNQAVAMLQALIATYGSWDGPEVPLDILALRLKSFDILGERHFNKAQPQYQLIIEVISDTSPLVKRATLTLSPKPKWITDFIYRSGLQPISDKGCFQVKITCDFGIDTAEWMPQEECLDVTAFTTSRTIKLVAMPLTNRSGRL